MAAKKQVSKNGKKKGKASKKSAEEKTCKPVIWTKERTWRLLGVLQEFDYLRKAVWSGPGEKSTGHPKIQSHEKIAAKLFGPEQQEEDRDTEYEEYFQLPGGLRYYGTAVKGRLQK
jgi:hypothetical protein